MNYIIYNYFREKMDHPGNCENMGHPTISEKMGHPTLID